MYADASAAFLGPNIWDKSLTEFKMDDLDLDALLGGTDEGPRGPQKAIDCNQINSNEKVPNHHLNHHHHHHHHHIPAQDAHNLVPGNT